EITRAAQVQCTAYEFGGRRTDREAHAHARHREGVVLASEGKHAPPATNADNETALGEDDAHRAGFCEAWRCKARRYEESQQGNEHHSYPIRLHGSSFSGSNPDPLGPRRRKTIVAARASVKFARSYRRIP